MSDKHDDHGHDDHGHDDGGGHEIDRMPNSRLFNLLFGLSALTLVAGIGVVQLFNIQVEALEDSRAKQGSFRLAAYLEEMQQVKTGSGKVTVAELDDKATVNTRYFMPLANARKAVLDDPNKLKAFGAYPGWKTSDEQAPAAVAPAPTPRPTAPPKPDAPTPEPAKPEPAKPEPAKPDAPAPAKPEPAKPDAPAPEPSKPDAPKPDAPKPDAPNPDAPNP